MADVFSRAKRSAVMARIRSKGNLETEIATIHFFRKSGFSGWRRNQMVLGRPDFIFPKAKVAVFVDGCFWHCCPKHGTIPAGNRSYWRRKLKRNKERDQQVNRDLRKQEWKVLRIWYHELRLKNHATLSRRLTRALSGPKPTSKR